MAIDPQNTVHEFNPLDAKMATSSAAPAVSPRPNPGGTNYLATEVPFVSIATLLVVTRIYVRTVIVRKPGLDDALIVLATVIECIETPS